MKHKDRAQTEMQTHPYMHAHTHVQNTSTRTFKHTHILHSTNTYRRAVTKMHKHPQAMRVASAQKQNERQRAVPYKQLCSPLFERNLSAPLRR